MEACPVCCALLEFDASETCVECGEPDPFPMATVSAEIKRTDCPDCFGVGSVEHEQGFSMEVRVYRKSCPTCDGRGGDYYVAGTQLRVTREELPQHAARIDGLWQEIKDREAARLERRAELKREARARQEADFEADRRHRKRITAKGLLVVPIVAGSLMGGCTYGVTSWMASIGPKLPLAPEVFGGAAFVVAFVWSVSVVISTP